MAIIAITNKLIYHVELLTDVATLGSDDGITANTTAWVDQYKCWFYPDTILSSASGWSQILTQTTGFVGAEPAYFSGATQDTLGVGASNQLIATLGSLAVNGQNMKVIVKVTGVDDAVDTNFIAFTYEQYFYRQTGTVSSVGAFDDQTNATGVGDFTSNVSFNVTAVGDDIRLRATNGSSTATYVLNNAYIWTIQEGGFNS